MIVRARVVLPMSQPPIEDGAIHVSGNKILKVGRWRDLESEAGLIFDLGDAIVVPGLVNAHCHLDYTNMAGMISPPKSFSDWIKALIAIKAQWSYSEFSQSWINGAQMLLRTGTTTVADIEAVPELLPEVWDATPLRVVSLLEMISVKSRHSTAKIIAEAAGKIASLKSTKSFAGLSPHALYSTSPELLKRSAEIAQENNWLVSTHVAESREELEMFQQRSGSLFDWLKSQRDNSDCGTLSPVEQLEDQGMLRPNFLAVHANYILHSDAETLAKRESSVVHCPRSHEYFGHQKFPQKLLADAGVNICLGTDSLASVASKPKKAVALSMFLEMQQFARNNPDVSAEKILQMSTSNGARALGLAGKIGALSAGAFADLVALPFSAATDPYETVVQNRADVTASLIEGAWAISPA